MDEDGGSRFIIIQSSYVVKLGGEMTGYNETQYVCIVCKDDVRREFPDLL